MGTSFENIIVPQVISLQDDRAEDRAVLKKNGIVLEENSILKEILRYNC